MSYNSCGKESVQSTDQHQIWICNKTIEVTRNLIIQSIVSETKLLTLLELHVSNLFRISGVQNRLMIPSAIIKLVLYIANGK